MNRLDYYDITPAGLDAYMSNYGRHFSKALYEWAVSMMKDRNGVKVQAMSKQEVDEKMKAASVTVERDMGYDVPYAYMMAKADYMGSSIADEQHLAKFVKDYLDDKDGSDTRAFDEFYAKTIALGIPIMWEDVI